MTDQVPNPAYYAKVEANKLRADIVTAVRRVAIGYTKMPPTTAASHLEVACMFRHIADELELLDGDSLSEYESTLGAAGDEE